MTYRLPKRRERVSHADDWLMTYADVITLLLCFFAVFLSVSLPRKDAAPVMPPAAVQEAPPQIAEAKPEETMPVVERLDELLAEMKETEEAKPVVPKEEPPPVVQAERAAAVEAPPENPPAPPPDIAQHPEAQNAAEFEKKGDRITTLDMDSAAFFDSGSATISENGRAILADVAKKIQADEFKDYQVTVEGHTDDSPIKTALFPSNWELSTARASAVVHFFLEQGLPAQKLRAAGYADTFPKAPNRDANGNPIPENQAQNRRVVIKLEKIERG